MTAGQIVLAALFAWALVVGFILAVIITGGRKRRPAPPAPRMPSDTPVYDYLARAGADRQAVRLRAELDDDAAVDRWLSGGAS